MGKPNKRLHAERIVTLLKARSIRLTPNIPMKTTIEIDNSLITNALQATGLTAQKEYPKAQRFSFYPRLKNISIHESKCNLKYNKNNFFGLYRICDIIIS